LDYFERSENNAKQKEEEEEEVEKDNQLEVKRLRLFDNCHGCQHRWAKLLRLLRVNSLS